MGKGICVNKTRVLGAMHFIYSKINLLDVAPRVISYPFLVIV